jgi:hypothetical protein
MNEHDAKNFEFLLSLTPEALEVWFYQASEDDQNYAEELITQAHIIAIDAAVAKMPHYIEAQQVLERFL